MNMEKKNPKYMLLTQWLPIVRSLVYTYLWDINNKKIQELSKMWQGHSSHYQDELKEKVVLDL